MPTRLLLIVAAALLMLRVPALAQPMGADQGLYAYVGERILAGELPYRDAWDQKPPAIHYTYALMRAAWSGDGAVGAADLLAAAHGGLAALSPRRGDWVVRRGCRERAPLPAAVESLTDAARRHPSARPVRDLHRGRRRRRMLLLLRRTAGTGAVRVLAAGVLVRPRLPLQVQRRDLSRLGRARGVAVAADRVARVDRGLAAASRYPCSSRWRSSRRAVRSAISMTRPSPTTSATRARRTPARSRWCAISSRSRSSGPASMPSGRWAARAA